MTNQVRADIDANLVVIADSIVSPTDLAYAIGKLCDETIIDAIGHDSTIKTVVGVLETAKLDFYQRHAVPLTIEDLHGEG